MFGPKVTPELSEKMDEFYERFDDIVPLEMMPSVETVEGLLENIQKCLDADENLLPAIYGWKYDGSIIY